MTANTITTTRTQVNAGYETSKFALGVGMATAAMIGLWATACMVSVLMNNGVVGTAKALLTAITG
ncbi:hypothetical protein UWK_00943 [Desulfocapsa sulfexigens DSM 10523]|uniref:Uncharacterized protein n=1 Tax=Desulfocapsa sulfexigens (strain DSM 10523 / SB164P1) TaxID=1167006 RepID=M1P761_DESSD|nr:hypothetical protein [Desulfocapsa sulfexigens]AGF77517.1 hypothetical protein UWK_00943 [Desulfocapsa sulfexigens DSM 10523]